MSEKAQIEAVLFSAGRSLSLKEIRDATGLEDDIVRKEMRKLVSSYGKRDTALVIVKIGSKYSLQLRAEYAEKTDSVAQKDLPREALKTVALIAYYQPLNKKKLKEMIPPGVNLNHMLDLLKKKKLIEIKRGRVGYDIMTTKAFLEYFGLEANDRIAIKKILSERAEEAIR